MPLRILLVVFFVSGCQTIVAPNGSEIVQRDGVTEIVQRTQEKPEPVCLVRARFFRGMVGVPCSDLAQEIRP